MFFNTFNSSEQSNEVKLTRNNLHLVHTATSRDSDREIDLIYTNNILCFLVTLLICINESTVNEFILYY